MDKFHIRTPGGYEVEIKASSEAEAIEKAKAGWQTMPKIIFKGAGDVRVFENSSGKRYAVSPGYSTSDAARIEQIMSEGAGEASKTSIREGILAEHPIASRLTEFVRGTPFVGSYADEAVGAVFGDKAKTGMRAASEAMREERPGQTLALNLAGGVVGSAPLIAAAPAAIPSTLGTGTRLAQVARGGAAGAAMGGLEGAIYGSGEGVDAETRKEEAKRYGVMGVGAGGLLGAATPVVSGVAGNIVNRFRRNDVRTIAGELGISTDAAKVIRNTFDAGGDVNLAISRLNEAGDSAMIADAGPAAQALLDATIASGGRASDIAGTAVSGRMAATGEAARREVGEALGEASLGPRTAVAEIQRRTAPQRAAAYNAALNQPVDYSAQAGRNIEEVVSRIPMPVLRDAVNEANEEILARQLPVKQIMASVDDDGAVTLIERLNAYQLNELKKALDGAAQAAKGEFGVSTSASMRYSDLARELRDSMTQALPGYDEALKLGGDTIAERNAFALGEGILSPKTRVEDVVIALGDNPSNAVVEAAKRGLSTEVDRVMGEVRALPSRPDVDAGQALQLIKSFSSDNVRAKITALLGDDAAPLLKSLDEAMSAASLQANVARNSATASRLAQAETIKDITSPGILGQAASGELAGTSKELIRAVTGQTAEFSAGQRQQIYADIAKALTEARGENAIMTLRAIDQAMAAQGITEAQTNMLANALSSSLYGGGTPALSTRWATE